MRDIYEQVYYRPSTPSPIQGGEEGGGGAKKSVLGRFLKLGKSKSDVHGVRSFRPRPPPQDDYEEFRLPVTAAPSTAKGLIQRMVQKGNARKDVSRSHSWIYGSVKLPGDLPFGYDGPEFSPEQRRRWQLEYGRYPPEPPCEGCNCGSGGEEKMYGTKHEHQQQYFFPEGRKQSEESKLVSSVRKLTWKSLKQAVKKRPSLDSIKKPNNQREGNLYDETSISNSMRSSYFFPDKKNFFASCHDLHSDYSPRVTASVRLRPKRPRQPWPFSNEFGPIPNYVEESSLYHSEWDLRQFTPYDLWLNNGPSGEGGNKGGNSGKANNYADPNEFSKERSSYSNSMNRLSRRASILENENLNAYQLLRGEKNGACSSKKSEEVSDSDELSDNALVEDQVRIAGQGMYMIHGGNGGASRSNSANNVNSVLRANLNSRLGEEGRRQGNGEGGKEMENNERMKMYSDNSTYSDSDPKPNREEKKKETKRVNLRSNRAEKEDEEMNKYGALRRRRNKGSLSRETILEEDSSDGEKGVYAVKIIVSNSGTEYVKPILKKSDPPLEFPNERDDEEEFKRDSRPVKKVQFDAHHEVVVCSEPNSDYSESEKEDRAEEEEPIEEKEKQEPKAPLTPNENRRLSLEEEVRQVAETMRRKREEKEEKKNVEFAPPPPPPLPPCSYEDMGEKTEVGNKKRTNGPIKEIIPKRPSPPPVTEPVKKPVAPKVTRGVRILNPNSLLFHDTTRIRLNQARPSIEETFKLNIGSAKGNSKSSRVKLSNSFRNPGSSPLRPKEPPPPPPVLNIPRPKKIVKEIPKKTPSVIKPPRPQISSPIVQENIYQNKPITKIPPPQKAKGVSFNSEIEKTQEVKGLRSDSSKLIPKEKKLGVKNDSKPLAKNESSNSNKELSVLDRRKNIPSSRSQSSYSKRDELANASQNIEIVTKENSVSEIRIYSGSKCYEEKKKTEEVKQAPQIAHFRQSSAPSQMISNSGPHSKSVVLIIETGESPQVTTKTKKIDSFPNEYHYEERKNKSSMNNMPSPQSLVEKKEEIEDPLYDDVLLPRIKLTMNSVTQTNSNNDQESLKSKYTRAVPGSQVPKSEIKKAEVPPSLPPPNPPQSNKEEAEENFYNDIKVEESVLIYDDTLSLLSSNYNFPERMNQYNLLNHRMAHLSPEERLNMISYAIGDESLTSESEPIYDDVLNLISTVGETQQQDSSDSGAETEDSTPPPLPASGPPPLPKVSTELPLLSFPLLKKHSEHLEEAKDNEETSAVQGDNGDKGNLNKLFSMREGELGDRTRNLLDELNEKLAKLDYSKAIISSSSESSGVEEDYNSEKNYSLSNGSSEGSPPALSLNSTDEAYKLTNLVTDTISMARGKFLASMKLQPPFEEPIYEEIGGEGNFRPHSPIYADAFDAKPIFEGASRVEILSFLESIKDRLATQTGFPDSLPKKKGKKGAEVERNDSGIGSEASCSLSPKSSCSDCTEGRVEEGTICRPCTRKRSERKEILMEIYETEEKYGRDLKIIADEFFAPIQTAALLSKDQLDQIFLNVDQLIDLSGELTCQLKASIGAAAGKEHLDSVNVGKIFLGLGEKMMSAFESYCTRQANAGALLTQLEKEKELLRIFLRVSQMENAVLRRMNLPAFLMVPVQRVTRYPLLLSRLLKVTPLSHPYREELQAAQETIEQHLEYMNKTTREVGNVKLWRRISIINGSVSSGSNLGLHRRSNSDLDGPSVRIRKMALDVLDWANFSDVTCVIENQLSSVQFNGKNLRNIYGCLLARGKDLEALAVKMDQDMFFPPADDLVKDVKLVLVRVKNTRFCLLREPLCLSKCVISQGENEFQDFIEINEITTKNTYYLQGVEKSGTCEWLRLLQCHAACVGQWRRRRGALANIMMNGMIRHI